MERERERESDLFAPDPHYSTLSISAASLLSVAYTPTGLQAHFPPSQPVRWLCFLSFAPIKIPRSLSLLLPSLSSQSLCLYLSHL